VLNLVQAYGLFQWGVRDDWTLVTVANSLASPALLVYL